MQQIIDVTTQIKFWDWLTTFFDYLTDEDKDLFENYWYGMTISGNVLIKKADRFLNSSAPESSFEYVDEDFYEVQIGPLHSRPINSNPTEIGQNYIIRPISKILIEPQYNEDLTPIYHDAIEIASNDYYNIRSIGLECYVVVKVKNESIADQYFKIFNLLSSEETVARKAYAEVDVTLTDPLVYDETIGRIAIEALYYPDDGGFVDVSNYDVSFVDNLINPTITWDIDSLRVNVNGKTITEIIALANAPDSNRWAILTDKSGKKIDSDDRKSVAPTFEYSPIKFHDLPNYRHSSEDGGRHYPNGGMVWQWYEGFENIGSEYIGQTEYGEYIEDKSKNKYIIVVDGDLSYIGDNLFSIYLTTGLAYDIDTWVLNLPQLQTHITEGYPIEFKVNRDYTVVNNIVEFNHNIFESGEVSNEDILYCPKSQIVEHYLYDLYGNLVGIPDWSACNYNSISGKTAINSGLLSLQNISNLSDYKRILNAYYGLPISPKNGKVVGLYESYGYEVINISGTNITLKIKTGSELHPFIQGGGRLFIEGKSDTTIFSVVNRTTGEVQMRDTSGISVGDFVHVKLRNRYILKDVFQEDGGDPAYITIYTPEGHQAIQHIIDIVNGLSRLPGEDIGKKWPEIIIYNTEGLEYNFNGIYHITKAEPYVGAAKTTKLTIYKKPDGGEPEYNDYIGADMFESDPAGRHGSVHIPWLTHKFLYILMDDNEYFKAYMDSPIDTIFDDEDVVEKYQILARNVSILTGNIFKHWVQFNNFKRYNGINLESDSLEAIRALPGAVFGKYFPSGYIQTE